MLNKREVIFWCCLFAAAMFLTARPAHAYSSFTGTYPTGSSGYACDGNSVCTSATPNNTSGGFASWCSQANFGVAVAVAFVGTSSYSSDTYVCYEVSNNVARFAFWPVGTLSCAAGYIFNSATGSCDVPVNMDCAAFASSFVGYINQPLPGTNTQTICAGGAAANGGTGCLVTYTMGSLGGDYVVSTGGSCAVGMSPVVSHTPTMAEIAAANSPQSAVQAASAVAADSTMADVAARAVAAAYKAAINAGASSSVAATISQQAGAQAAADQTRQAQQQFPIDYNKEVTQQLIKADLDAIKQSVANPASSPSVDVCIANPDRDGCKNYGIAPATETVPTQTPTFSTSALTFASSTGCPADVTFTIGGSLLAIAGTYHLSFTPVCNVMSTLRPIFLALAAISAAFIFAAGLSI